MNALLTLHQAFLNYYKIETNINRLKEACQLYTPEMYKHPAEFLRLFLETGRASGLIYVTNEVSHEEFQEALYRREYPFLSFQKNEPLQFLFFTPDRDTIKVSDPLQDSVNFDPHHIMDKVWMENNRYFLITCYPELAKKEPDLSDHKSTFTRLYQLLNLERRDIALIYIYAAISGIIGLSLPLGVQSIIGFAASGQLTTSIVVLIIFIVLGIVISGGMQVMQLYLVEYMQRRIFARTTFEFAWKLPRIRVEAIMDKNVPELVNRFFDLITLEKGLSKLLVEFSAAMLQILFGLMLLSFYHSSFIFLGLVLVVILYLIIRLTGGRGMRSNLNASKYKYKIAAWLEEIGRSFSTFRLSGYSNIPLEKTDQYLSSYLSSRRTHFQVLVVQYFSFIGFKTLITAGLLIIGCILLINREINIGEFVASEIIIILVMSAVEKVILQLDSIYDVLTSLEKISAVTDLPVENSKGLYTEELAFNGPLEVELQDLSYHYVGRSGQALDKVNLKIKAGEKICLSGYEDAGRRTLANIVLNMLSKYEGAVLLNRYSLRDLHRNSLMQQIGDNISQEDVFEGSIYENITLGELNADKAKLSELLEVTGLDKIINRLPDGLRTHVIPGVLGIQQKLSRRILLARSMLKNPGLLILEDHFSDMEPEDKDKLLRYLVRENAPWTLIFISNDPELQRLCDRTVVMEQGAVIVDTHSNDPQINKALRIT